MLVGLTMNYSTTDCVEIADEQKALYFKMRADFATLAGCQAIWDITTHQATDRFRERTACSTFTLMSSTMNYQTGNCVDLDTGSHVSKPLQIKIGPRGVKYALVNVPDKGQRWLYLKVLAR